ncbi:hypothetical protein FALCPG4_003324, partial [Fusarium falciforme]
PANLTGLASTSNIRQRGKGSPNFICSSYLLIQLHHFISRSSPVQQKLLLNRPNCR